MVFDEVVATLERLCLHQQTLNHLLGFKKALQEALVVLVGYRQKVRIVLSQSGWLLDWRQLLIGAWSHVPCVLMSVV